MSNETGKWIIAVGIFIVIAGVIVYFFSDKLQWIGRLPGDIRIERKNFKFYFPITTTILFSLLLTFIMYVVRKFF